METKLVSDTHLSTSTTEAHLPCNQEAGAHNTKASIVTALSADILSDGSLLRRRDTTFATPAGALTSA